LLSIAFIIPRQVLILNVGAGSSRPEASSEPDDRWAGGPRPYELPPFIGAGGVFSAVYKKVLRTICRINANIFLG